MAKQEESGIHFTALNISFLSISLLKQRESNSWCFAIGTASTAASSSKKPRTDPADESEAVECLATPAGEKSTQCRVSIMVHAIKATADGGWETKVCESLANVQNVERQLAKVRVRRCVSR
jgi:hypothetical protein